MFHISDFSNYTQFIEFVFESLSIWKLQGLPNLQWSQKSCCQFGQSKSYLVSLKLCSVYSFKKKGISSLIFVAYNIACCNLFVND